MKQSLFTISLYFTVCVQAMERSVVPSDIELCKRVIEARGIVIDTQTGDISYFYTNDLYSIGTVNKIIFCLQRFDVNGKIVSGWRVLDFLKSMQGKGMFPRH